MAFETDALQSVPVSSESDPEAPEHPGHVGACDVRRSRILQAAIAGLLGLCGAGLAVTATQRLLHGPSLDAGSARSGVIRLFEDDLVSGVCVLRDPNGSCEPTEAALPLSCCSDPPGSVNTGLQVSGFVPYFDYIGIYKVAGSVQLSDDGSSEKPQQILDWNLGNTGDPFCADGPRPGVPNSCGIHIHAGTSCTADALGHFFASKSDPWKSVTYRTGQLGKAVAVPTGLPVASVLGRVVIVHDSSGIRIACGLITPQALFATGFVPYVGYMGPWQVSGQVAIVGSGIGETAQQSLSWTLAGADPTCQEGAKPGVANSCGIHIHKGTSCGADALGHAFAVAEDPWKAVSYKTGLGGESAGTAQGIVTGLTNNLVQGATLIVHDVSGARIACSIISFPLLAVPSFSPYFDYTGKLEVTGIAQVGSTLVAGSTAQVVAWHLSGVDPECRTFPPIGVPNACGIHIHRGTSCASDAEGHLYAGVMDPWAPVFYDGGDRGEARGLSPLVPTGLDGSDLLGHTLIVHDSRGARIACGVLSPSVGW